MDAPTVNMLARVRLETCQLYVIESGKENVDWKASIWLTHVGSFAGPADVTQTSAHALAWLPASASTPAWRANRLMAAQLARCAPAGWVRLAVSPLALCSARRLAGARAAPVRVAGPPLARKYGLRQIVNAWPTGPNNGSSVSIWQSKRWLGSSWVYQRRRQTKQVRHGKRTASDLWGFFWQN